MALFNRSLLIALALLSASASAFVVPTRTARVGGSNGYLCAAALEEDTGPLQELEIKDLAIGSGDASEIGDVIRGKFDLKIMPSTESLSSGDFCVKLGDNQVVRGWDEGMVGLKAGGKRNIKIPAKMAYGGEGKGSIPPGADLEIEITVDTIAKGDFAQFLARFDLGLNPRTAGIFFFLGLAIFTPQIYKALGLN